MTGTPGSGTPGHTRRLLALLAAAALTLTACSGESEPTSGGGSAPAPEQEKTKAAPAPKRSPLTGLTAGRLPERRAVVVKVENTENSEPQVGLGSADLVVEELVEGGLTRLAAFYHSSLPSRVGPVRSYRGTDIALVKPARAVLVASGGAPRVERRVDRSGIVTAPQGTRGFFRVGDRPSPYNLFVNLKRLPKPKLSGPAPRPYLPWGQAKDLEGGRPAEHITANFSAATATRWNWTGQVWRRTTSHAPRSDEFRTDNVLALRVKQVSAGYEDAAGNPVPESVLVGKGEATLFHDGQAYRGTWVKKTPRSTFRLVTAQGEPMPVPPGHTFVELIPASGGGGLSFGR